MTMGNYLNYPLSRGAIHISGKDVYSPPEFNAGFLSHPADLAPFIWVYKKMREIMRRMPSFRGELAETHPHFGEGSAAKCIEGYNHADIVYSLEDDEAIERWTREKVGTCWHSMYVLMRCS